MSHVRPAHTPVVVGRPKGAFTCGGATGSPDDRVGCLIAHHRKRKGISQTELGNAIGLVPSIVSRTERGLAYASPARRNAIAAALGIDPEILADPELMEVSASERELIADVRRLAPDQISDVRRLIASRLSEAAPC